MAFLCDLCAVTFYVDCESNELMIKISIKLVPALNSDLFNEKKIGLH